MKGKKVLALTLCTAMAAGTAMTTMAAGNDTIEGSQEATGTVQYVKIGDVFNVVLPTSAGTTFDYLLDPDKLIAATSADGKGRYGDAKFEADKTVYFKHAEKVGDNDYTDTSDAVKVINKSTQDVSIKLKAKIDSASGVTMDTDGQFSSTGNFYMAVKSAVDDGSGSKSSETTTALTTAEQEITATIPKDDDAYTTVWDASLNAYKKEISETAKADDYTGFNFFEFQLTGKAKEGETALTALKDAPPKVQLTWSVEDTITQLAPPSLATTSFALTTDQPLEIPVRLGKGDMAATKVDKVELFGIDLLTNTTYGTTSYATDKITLSKEIVNVFTSTSGSLPATLTVIFDDDETNPTKVDVTLTKAE